MDAIIRLRPELHLVGLAIQVTLDQVQDKSRPTYALAAAFLERAGEIGFRVDDEVTYGLSTDPENYNPATDAFEFFIGIEVHAVRHIPDGMVARRVPAGLYVEFLFVGPASGAGAVHNYLYTTWLKENPYALSGTYNLEIYDEEFDGPESQHSSTTILFPIRKKEVLK